jgi:hypothetical protein
MKTFYDFRNNNFNNPKAFPLKGVVLLKTKTKWIVWVKTIGLIVCPRSVYLFNWYMPKNIIDALKHLFKK